MTNEYIQNLLRFYTGLRELVQSLRLGTNIRQGRSSQNFEDVIGLGAAVTAGKLEIGGHVTGKGWLSPYAYWYLPKAYSPYRFDSVYAVSEDGRPAVRMTPSPAFLPAGSIPFERDNLVLGFLYPTSTSGFTLELANPPSVNIPIPEIKMQSAEDQPWVFGMDNGVCNCSLNPEKWIYSVGASELFDQIPRTGKEANLTLTDPARVREVVEVPTECKPIPVLYPRGHCRSNRYVEFSARITELDRAILSELSSLGAPLTQKVYSLFNQPCSDFPAFCLSVNGEDTNLRPIEAASASNQPSPKLATLLVEFFFETEAGELLPFGDTELLELVIPSVKDQTFSLDNIHFPDRWLSKVYGFEGPVYMVKTGPIEMSISPAGAYSAYTIADLSVNRSNKIELLERFVQRFQRSMLELYPKRMGKKAIVRTTYLTDGNWQSGFGKLLEGQTFEDAARRSQQFFTLRQDLQSAAPQSVLNNYGSMVNSPVQMGTTGSVQTTTIGSETLPDGAMSDNQEGKAES